MIVAPAAGVVSFAGAVVDRGVLTIDHGDGVVSAIEPVDGLVAEGEAVAAGDPIGVVASGGHCAPGACTSACGSTASTCRRSCSSAGCRVRCCCRCREAASGARVRHPVALLEALADTWV